MSKAKRAVPVEDITRRIVVLRGQRVVLDAELATLYGVSTKRFNEQVRRNRERFPEDFMFQLTPEEHAVPLPKPNTLGMVVYGEPCTGGPVSVLGIGAPSVAVGE